MFADPTTVMRADTSGTLTVVSDLANLPYGGGGDAMTGERPLPMRFHEHFEQVKERLHRTVQTNEPGRSAVLFAGLLWRADRATAARSACSRWAPAQA